MASKQGDTDEKKQKEELEAIPGLVSDGHKQGDQTVLMRKLEYEDTRDGPSATAKKENET